ncbi:MAG: hypothetical protein WD023_12295 [Ilumatobacteraceae bacterium]
MSEALVAAPRRGHRIWAVPLVVVALATLFVVIAASVLPGSLVAQNAADETATFARVPAEAQPVADGDHPHDRSDGHWPALIGQLPAARPASAYR